MIIRAITGLVVAGALHLLSSQIYAANSGALELLEQGHSECKSAQLYRRKDFDKAKEIYNNYLELKRQALGKDSSLADGSDPGVKRILDYCERVGSDIARVEAMPVFMQGLEACKAAEVQMRSDNLSKAQERYQAYEGYREQAIKISEWVLDVPSLASDLQRCERVHSYLEAESSRIAGINKRIRASIAHLEKARTLCNSAKSSKRTDPDWFEGQHEEVLGMESSVPNQKLLKGLSSGSKDAKTLAGLRAGIAACEKQLVATIAKKKQSKVTAERARQKKARQLAESLRQKELAAQKAKQQAELRAEQERLAKRLAAEEARKRKASEAETERRRLALVAKEANRLRALALQEERQRKEIEAQGEARRKAWEEEDKRRRERLAREEAERSKAWEAEDKRRRAALALEEERKRKEIAGAAEVQRQKLAKEESRRRQALIEEDQRLQAEQKERDRRVAERQQEGESAPDGQARLIANAAYYNLVRQVRPVIPRDTLPSGTSGYVIIEYFINTKGRVIDPVVVASQPTPVLGKLTLKAIQKWRYKPNFKGREKEEAFVRAQINFVSQN